MSAGSIVSRVAAGACVEGEGNTVVEDGRALAEVCLLAWLPMLPESRRAVAGRSLTDWEEVATVRVWQSLSVSVGGVTKLQNFFRKCTLLRLFCR